MKENSDFNQENTGKFDRNGSGQEVRLTVFR